MALKCPALQNDFFLTIRKRFITLPLIDERIYNRRIYRQGYFLTKYIFADVFFVVRLFLSHVFVCKVTNTSNKDWKIVAIVRVVTINTWSHAEAL